MKLLHFYLLVLVLALGACGRGSDSASSSENRAYDNIMTRTSIRQYTDEAVSRSAVDSLLRAGMAAPTAANKQPWCFVVIDRRDMLDSISGMAPGWRPASRAPLAIVVCGDRDKAIDGEGSEYWIQDCSAVSENILLAAHSMGLGAVWCGVYPVQERTEALSAFIGFPPSIVPLSLIVIGHPAENPAPKDKFDSTAIYFNRSLPF